MATQSDIINANFKYLNDKIKDIELFKFPNAIITGNPTINNGQVSGFTTNDYMQFPFILDLHNTPFQIDFCFTTGNDVTTQQNILDSQFGLALAIANGKGLMAISGNGTSWNIGSSVGTIPIQPNTTHYARLTWNGTEYKTLISTDGGESYEQDMYLVGTQRPYPRTIFIGGANSTVLGHEAHPFLGSINMNKAYLYIRSQQEMQLIWQGMDDAGLATRADISLSNLDSAGEARFSEKQNKLKAGDNIVISEDGTIAVVGIAGSGGTGVVKAGSGITVVDSESSDFDNAFGCWHFENSTADSIHAMDLGGCGTTTNGEHKFGGYAFIPNKQGEMIGINTWLKPENDFTMDFWVKKSEQAHSDLIIGFVLNELKDDFLGVRLLDGGHAGILVRKGTVDTNIEKYILTGGWNHIALCYAHENSIQETNVVSVYVNGMRVYKQTNVNATYNHFSIEDVYQEEGTEVKGECYIDELRLSNIAQYDGEFFTLKSEPYIQKISTVSAFVDNDTIVVNSENKLATKGLQRALTEAQLLAVNSGIRSEHVTAITTVLPNKQDKLTAGDNITIKDGTISADITLPDTVWSQDNLAAGTDISFVEEQKPDEEGVLKPTGRTLITNTMDTSSFAIKVDVATSLAKKVDTITVVEDLEHDVISVDVVPNTVYNYGTITSLTIQSVQNSFYESVIYFTAGNDDCLSIPSDVKTIGNIATTSGKSYVVAIMNNILIIGEQN